METRDAARALGVSAEACGADLRDNDATDKVVAAAVESFGRLDILINNAAIFPDTDTFTTTDRTLWDELFAVNLRAPFFLSQAFARHLGQRQGNIVNIADARVRHPQTDHFAYRLTKGALWQMTEMLALELAPRATVNAIALGAILPPPGRNHRYLEDIAARHIPLRRPGDAKDVAENVLHLLTQEFVTGTVIELDGGQFL
jgi:glucose 1-dehydrogenase